MSLANELYQEACEYLEKAAQIDRSKMEPKALQLHDAYVAYFKNIKEEISSSQSATASESKQQATLRLIKLGMTTPLISRTTGLSFAEIDSLRPKKKKDKK